MGKIEKIVDRMKRSKYGHTFEDCCKVLEAKGYAMKEGRGSHFKFFKDQNMIVIAKHRPIDPKAIEDIIRVWEA